MNEWMIFPKHKQLIVIKLESVLKLMIEISYLFCNSIVILWSFDNVKDFII